MNKTLRNLALVALVAAPFSAFADIKGAGTAADPYQIATVEDLQGAYKLTKVGETIYFVQTADIDMTGVADWHPLTGYTGGADSYGMIINYDGRNHVIKNFAPTVPAWSSETSGAHKAYGATLFGVPSGVIANLGVENAKCVSNHGTGILGAYAGYSAGSKMTVKNVYVTGEVNGTGKYAGGMFGCTGNDAEIENCFVNVKLTSTDAATNLNGGFIGRANNSVSLTNVYAAGTVPAEAGLFTAGTGAITIDGAVAFNTGAEKACLNTSVTGDVTMANTSATQAAGIAAVQAWPAFSATENVDGFPALEYTLAGEGTEANPYIIDSAKALCNAYRYVDGTKTGITYFIQTADIDMKGVTTYYPISGWDGSYAASLNYDGQNHVITGFAPEEPKDLENGNPYYSNTIFGVLSGTLKNLGVIDATCNQKLQGIGILAAYIGHAKATETPSNYVENVFVTGTVDCGKDATYAGGMFGTTATPTVLFNCFANVDLAITETSTVGGGLIGRVANDSEFENCYVAGIVAGAADKVYLVSNTNATPELLITNVVAFNTGATAALAPAIKNDGDVEVATAANKAQLIADVQEWEEFSATKVIDGYPILKAFEVYGVDGEQSGIFDAAVEDGSDAPAVYYNLQGVQVNNPENGIYIVRRGNKVTKEVIR